MIVIIFFCKSCILSILCTQLIYSSFFVFVGKLLVHELVATGNTQPGRLGSFMMSARLMTNIYTTHLY